MRDSRTIHARLDDDVILSILDVVNDDSKPLSSQFAEFCGIMVSELREAEIINVPPEDASSILDDRLKILGRTDMKDFRKIMRDKIAAAEEDLTQPHPDSFNIPDDGNPPVALAVLDVDNIDFIDWLDLKSGYPMDRIISAAGDDVVMHRTIGTVYETLDVSDYGSEKAERLIREMYPRVEEWALANSIRKVDPDAESA